MPHTPKHKTRFEVGMSTAARRAARVAAAKDVKFRQQFLKKREERTLKGRAKKLLDRGRKATKITVERIKKAVGRFLKKKK